MAIWFNPAIKIEDLQAFGVNTMGSHIGIEFTEIGENYLKGRMPVDERTRQPYGLLHGGASATFAETLGSVAAALTVDPSKHICVGLEINANHIRGVREGYVIGTATPLHIGRTTQVWDIKIHDEKEQLVCVSRHTVSVLTQRQP